MYCCGPHFPQSASLLLLRALKETVQSVATVKCALDRSVYRAIIKALGSK
jgi:hypothetical protein